MCRINRAVGAFFFGSTSLLADIIKTDAYRGLTGENLQAVLQEAGYRAELTEDSVGDPLIRTGLDGSNVNIWFYNCVDGTWNNIRFIVGLDLRNGTTLEKVNDFNEGWIIATATMDDENDPWI
ncbi:MAG: YbjN domain-containing protein [Gammaproteobacteria bacterium]|nr:YbjN domain-containing protein [Gammaproteobacteria bacterium]